MAFLVRCPNCGERNVYEFRYGGEVRQRPLPTANAKEVSHYFYARKNEAGVEKEWWYHRHGCKNWFMALRDKRTNTVLKTFWPEEA
ncbi:MAG: sarcosine oxidase subunit delta [Candidatus Bathyarchaeia archaeon]